MDAAVKHCTAGLGIWSWASNDRGGEPDVVMACCGDLYLDVGFGMHRRERERLQDEQVERPAKGIYRRKFRPTFHATDNTENTVATCSCPT
jgi:XFP C-terminal domain